MVSLPLFSTGLWTWLEQGHIFCFHPQSLLWFQPRKQCGGGGGFGVERLDPFPDWHGFKLEVVGGGGKGSNAKRSFTFCATWSNQVCAKHHHSLHSEALSASFGEEAEVVKAFAPVVLSSG